MKNNKLTFLEFIEQRKIIEKERLRYCKLLTKYIKIHCTNNDNINCNLSIFSCFDFDYIQNKIIITYIDWWLNKNIFYLSKNETEDFLKFISKHEKY
jgi:hypothetical protein